jgi:hypothetical protein
VAAVQHRHSGPGINCPGKDHIGEAAAHAWPFPRPRTALFSAEHRLGRPFYRCGETRCHPGKAFGAWACAGFCWTASWGFRQNGFYTAHNAGFKPDLDAVGVKGGFGEDIFDPPWDSELFSGNGQAIQVQCVTNTLTLSGFA